jgi:hypothetical protein
MTPHTGNKTQEQRTTHSFRTSLRGEHIPFLYNTLLQVHNCRVFILEKNVGRTTLPFSKPLQSHQKLYPTNTYFSAWAVLHDHLCTRLNQYGILRDQDKVR